MGGPANDAEQAGTAESTEIAADESLDESAPDVEMGQASEELPELTGEEWNGES